MQSAKPAVWLTRSFVSRSLIYGAQRCDASLTSAIGRGVRKSNKGFDSADRSRSSRDREGFTKKFGNDREGFSKDSDRDRQETYNRVDKDSRASSARQTNGGDADRYARQLRNDSKRFAKDQPRPPRSFHDRRDATYSGGDSFTKAPRPYNTEGRGTRYGGNARSRDAETPSQRLGRSQDLERKVYAKNPYEMDNFRRRQESTRADPFGEAQGSYTIDDRHPNRQERRDETFGKSREKYIPEDRYPNRREGKGDEGRPKRQELSSSTDSRSNYRRLEQRGDVDDVDLESTRRRHSEQQDNARSTDESSSARASRLKVPLTVPYTTAGSEFLYGTFAVKAALQAERRKSHILYMYHGDGRDEDIVADKGIEKLALAAHVKVKHVSGEWIRLMGKMTGGRPHNGYVLEASPIPKLPATALQTVAEGFRTFAIDTAAQSTEDAEVNHCFEIVDGAAALPQVGKNRFPLVLMLDRILDPGNLGAIIRSCYFLGVDAVAMIEHGSAPFSPVTIKASAGAAEFLPIMVVKKDVEFIKASKQNGWKFVAAMSENSRAGNPPMDFRNGGLRKSPCVLLMGNEGEGLRPNLQRLADATASIANVRGSQQGIDSLNVSVAAALLAQKLLQPAETVSSTAAAEDLF